jgi:hypothetical protein
LDLLFRLQVGLELWPLHLLAVLEAPELVGILIITAEPEVVGTVVLTTAVAAALLAFLGMAETAVVLEERWEEAVILEAEATAAPQVDRAYLVFQQPFLVHLLILLRLDLVAPRLVRLLTAGALLEAQEALERVYPAVGLQTALMQAGAAS